jgi:hypothetical protein
MCSCSGFLVQDPDQFGLEAKAQKKREASLVEWWKRVIEGLSKKIMKVHLNINYPLQHEDIPTS